MPVAPRSADGLGIASLVLGILSLVTAAAFCICPFMSAPLGIAGLTCGLLSKNKGGVRVAGITCSAVGLAANLALTLVMVMMALLNP